MNEEWVKNFFAQNRILKASIRYAERPSEAELEALKKKLKTAAKATEVILDEKLEPELVGGYVLRIGGTVFDNSTAAAFDQLEAQLMKQLGEKDVIVMMKSAVSGFDRSHSIEEGGTVIRVGDGIAAVNGISHAEYGEIVAFQSGIKGMVQNIGREEILCILFGDDGEVMAGDKVIRTHKRAGVPVGEGFLGRVVNPLGEAIDEKGDIAVSDYYPIERDAPGVVARKSVTVPMQTGILVIDSMFPIGRGQRELIIGDRQTGKTAIAIDTILNQKETGVICVYVAIGQKASTIAQVVRTLDKHGAMDYTMVLAATASDCAALQYVAPYAGTSLAEYFMDQGRDVLVIYDDLTKHAMAYRALSLLLERSPGREAYPGDVFYLHSRLLERACRLNEENGGGSITALPIIETLAGDVAAYIPTNVISITDGQIFLESDLFFAGNRPAVNVGLSVSRVGGAAQTKSMKKASGSLRIDLAQYNEMKAFMQFSADLDDETRTQLSHGERLMEILKQPLYHPKSVVEQVIILCVAQNRLLKDLPKERIKEFFPKFLAWLPMKWSEQMEHVAQTGVITDEEIASLCTLAEEYKKVNGYGEC
ncbi:MAG: F0F1 ATP synthase subunit alpha [Evtepia sp.]